MIQFIFRVCEIVQRVVTMCLEVANLRQSGLSKHTCTINLHTRALCGSWPARTLCTRTHTACKRVPKES